MIYVIEKGLCGGGWGGYLECFGCDDKDRFEIYKWIFR